MNDLDAKQSTRRSRVMFLVASLMTAVAGGYGVLSVTNQTSRVLAALTMLFGLAAVVTGRLNMRRSKKRRS